MIKEHKKEDVSPDRQAEQFSQLMNWLPAAGYEHYEISNFAKPGYRSRHNSSYWQGKKFLGLGPSAHSFNGSSRQWNVANNSKYISALNKNELPFEKEILTPVQQLNEYIMTSLRTKEGLDLKRNGEIAANALIKTAGKYIDSGKMILNEDRLILTNEGKLLADGIAASLFFDQ
jgi:oxygen-independent coproporphyrinogen-3 oxidase